MEERKRLRGVYVTPRQKKKLIELMTKHPELISCKVTQDFSYRDSQKLWHSIATECNSIPGAKKSWRQWRKTWQDLRSKYRKRHLDSNGQLPTSVVLLSQAEQEALGLKNVSSTTNYHDDSKFIPTDSDNNPEKFDDQEADPSYSESESLPEEKVFAQTTKPRIKKKLKNSLKKYSKHSNNCVFNCDTLATQEQRKIQIKEDYLNFKKDYLRQKLKIMNEQTEALKCIAKELCSK